MKNKKQLVAIELIHKFINIFSNFFLNIYLFKISGDDFNFILAYSAASAIIGLVFCFFLMKILSPKTTNIIFRSSYICEIISLLMLLVFKEQILSIVWLFVIIKRYAKSSYYLVYEQVLLGSSGKRNLSSYVAGVNILGSIISLAAPILLGFMITDYSYYVAMGFILIGAVVSMVIAAKSDFSVVNKGFHPLTYWKKAFKNRTMRVAYLDTFLNRLSGTSGILQELLPILLFLALGTEFSVGSYDSLFSVVYIILLEIIRILNRRGVKKRLYVPLALLCLASAVVMVANFSVFSILLFYFAIKTGGNLIQSEYDGMIYSIGKKEKLARYNNEHHFTWSVFLTLGNLVCIVIAYFIYNYFYSKEAFAAIIVVLMIFFVLHAFLLQKIVAKMTRK